MPFTLQHDEQSVLLIIIYCSVIIILSAFIAIIIFKIFPKATADANGTITSIGLKYRAGGAFAGFIITAVMFYTFASLLIEKMIRDNDILWTVEGNIKLVRTDGSQHPGQRQMLTNLKMSIPPSANVLGNTATLKVIGTPKKIPDILIEVPNFGRATINQLNITANTKDAHYDMKSGPEKTVKLRDTIEILETSSGGNTLPPMSDPRPGRQLTENSDKP
jgi:hypothetical protein